MARITKKKQPAEPQAAADDSSLSLEVRPYQDKLLVIPHGKITEEQAHQLQKELLTLIDQGAERVVIDMSDVPFVTSTCLGAMMVAHKRLRAKGGYLRIGGAQPLVRQILEVTKLTRLFGRYDTPGDALAAD